APIILGTVACIKQHSCIEQFQNHHGHEPHDENTKGDYRCSNVLCKKGGVLWPFCSAQVPWVFRHCPLGRKVRNQPIRSARLPLLCRWRRAESLMLTPDYWRKG